MSLYSADWPTVSLSLRLEGASTGVGRRVMRWCDRRRSDEDDDMAATVFGPRFSTRGNATRTQVPTTTLGMEWSHALRSIVNRRRGLLDLTCALPTTCCHG